MLLNFEGALFLSIFRPYSDINNGNDTNSVLSPYQQDVIAILLQCRLFDSTLLHTLQHPVLKLNLLIMGVVENFE